MRLLRLYLTRNDFTIVIPSIAKESQKRKHTLRQFEYFIQSMRIKYIENQYPQRESNPNSDAVGSRCQQYI